MGASGDAGVEETVHEPVRTGRGGSRQPPGLAEHLIGAQARPDDVGISAVVEPAFKDGRRGLRVELDRE